MKVLFRDVLSRLPLLLLPLSPLQLMASWRASLQVECREDTRDTCVLEELHETRDLIVSKM